ncbi:alpha/beta hydrolase [Micromonospora sp. PLK6-60]|uniref:alpha/beta hydrolase n=1 Tax=Micromonospora sp. PLK6-60 TaxID=2873383 RepID=UPI001CA687E5|nr:alpha/beta hydrolase [Micromonospora sp. PLK6-60]MBY8870992.1 alpha/beta hydrolase [Micromonospora sp. PLK6-60]
MTRATFPRLAGLGLLGCLAVGVAHLGYATLMTHQGHRGYTRHQVRCASGNIIDYHVRPGEPGGPVLVCDAGLMSSSASWLLVADHLDPAVTVLLYDRAGYRGSLRRCPEDYALQESVNDLVEVIRHQVEPDATCVLAGHSLGGYLVHRAAAALPDRVRGVLLVDPTHPRELLHSRAQREGSRGVNLTMKLGPSSALFGAGLLIDKKGLFAFAEGSPHHRTLRLETSTVSTWRAARREWDYSYAFMLDGGRPLDRLRVPVSVVAAEATLDQTAEHRELYQEYVDSGTGGRIVTVAGSSHLSVIGGVDHAPRTAQEIARALAEADAAGRPAVGVAGSANGRAASTRGEAA